MGKKSIGTHGHLVHLVCNWQPNYRDSDPVLVVLVVLIIHKLNFFNINKFNYKHSSRGGLEHLVETLVR